VTRAEVMNGPVQAFRGLGIRRGQFKARLMRDSQPFQGGGILLVQWLDPTPVGVPYKEANHIGWYREHANASQTGQTARYQQALAAGGRPYGEPSAIAIRDNLTIYSFAFRDPDGTTLEWVGPLDPTPNGAPDTVAGPNVNCRDIRRSFAFYRDVMGFDMQIRLNPSTPQPGTNGSLGDTVRTPKGEIWTGLTDFDAAIMVPRTDGRNSVDLLEWQMPGSYGTPYKEANHLGAVNLAWEVNSVDVVHEKLRRLLKNPGRQIVAPPETWDLGDYGVRKVLNILDPDGVMLQFMEKIYSADPTP
jgi:catechol 2,3-dioxygenase-like lactoylglutathione lyase family enzyme